ncbi:MAG: antibiotic biosynthesis monooxygenase [Nitrososphaerales archaeon]
MKKIQLSSMMKIRKGKLEGFTRQVAECISQTNNKDPGTLQYDWFLNNDQTNCEVREAFQSSEALIAHWHNLDEALGQLFEKFAYDNTVVIYGDPSPQLLAEARRRIPNDRLKIYSGRQLSKV